MGRERRKNFRVEWHSPATIYNLDQQEPRLCVLSDFSNGGAKISGIAADILPDEFLLRFGRGNDRTRKCRVIWRTDDTVGVQFADRPKRKNKRNRDHRAHEPA